jgi:probable biosynthetic protein (TIGR04098 family)
MSTRVHRTTLKPAMCGPSALFLGQVGDWTWEAVSEACRTNVFAARDARGNPTYLAFYYYRVRANPSFHVGALTFGDTIDVRSTVFGFGSESVLTLHEIGPGGGALDPSPIDLEAFYERPSAGRVYVETYNRWITRSVAKSNEDLVLSSPIDFCFEHLPSLPDRYSPRPIYTSARRLLTFATDAGVEAAHRLQLEYPIDVARDVNGVGLVYFASYFAIVDGAILRLWRELGRDAASYLARVVVDRQICYLSNVNIDAVLAVDVALRWSEAEARDEVFDVVLRVQGGGRLVAVSTVRILKKEIVA